MRDILHPIADFLHSDVATVVEQILVLAAIILAIVHERALKRQLDHIRQVRDALPTKHLGEFPRYLEHIVTAIRHARQRIIICCDFPAYGSFSDPEAFRNYRHEIENKISESVPVTIACLDTDRRSELTREQFSMADAPWTEWKRLHLHQVERYLGIHAPGMTALQISNDEFISLIAAEDTHVYDSTFEAAKKIPLSQKPPIYFWLIDDTMVFAIPGAHRLMEHGFCTQDSHFIDGLCEIAQRYTPLVVEAIPPET